MVLFNCRDQSLSIWWCAMAVCALSSAHAQFRLPGDVRPAHYDVTALYDHDPATNFSFYAVVHILLFPVKPTNQIVLHAESYSISLDDVSLQGSKVSGIKLDRKYNFLIISSEKKLEPGRNYTLTIPFYGNLQEGLNGVYISSYSNKMTNLTEYLVTTQFQAISARKGFPCFDEPMYKATFALTLGHAIPYTAVSNMPLKGSSYKNALEPHWPWSTIAQRFNKSEADFTWDDFETTLPMSTYLVAFVISKFRYVESPAGLSTTKFRIWCRSDAINQASYAATIGPRVLDHFEKFFSVPFPLPKQDMFAIPDFAAGAMENWGLITYRESQLLYDPKESSLEHKEVVVSTIAHELAHQWFGNLVTMKWWTDLWLNEGFATYMSVNGEAAAEPTWKNEKKHWAENLFLMLSMDSLESSHPISVPIDDQKQITEIFDGISYRKGATLIRMMTCFLGEEVFRKAMHNYLVKYSFKNAEQDDLWAELTEVSQQHGGLSRDVTVKQVMDTWTKQTGYPLLTINRDYSDKSLTIRQRRYLSSDIRSSASWWVPLQVLCEPEAMGGRREGAPTDDPLQWLAKHEGVSSVQRFEHGSGPDQWVLFNYDIIAPYRVNYDERNWQLLIKTLKSEHYASIPELARCQLLSDAFELAWTGHQSYSTVLQLASYMSLEKAVLPLIMGKAGLESISDMLCKSPNYEVFLKFARSIVTPVFRTSGGLAIRRVMNKGDLKSVQRQTLISYWACAMKVPECEENAISLFKAWMETSNPDEENPIPLDLRRTVYCVALSRGSVREWRFALSRMRSASVAAAHSTLLTALTCTREPFLLAQCLEWSVTEESDIRTQDAQSVISGVTKNTVGYYIAREFIYKRIKDISRTFSGHYNDLGSVISVLLERFTTQDEMDEFNVWYKKNGHYLENTQMSVKQAIERAHVNIRWMAKNHKTIIDTLKQLSTTEDDLYPLRTRRPNRGSRGVLCVAAFSTNLLIIQIL